MRIILASVSALAVVSAAGAAAAQSSASGSVTITGSVSGKCSASAGFTDSYAIAGDMADVDGLLSSTLSGTTAAAPLFTKSFTVRCTGANAGVSVTATPLVNTAVTAPSGYTSTVNFTGRASVDLVSAPSGTSTLNVDDDSSVSGASSASAGAANFLANTANNVRISAYGLNTSTGALLTAGSYGGQVDVVVSPAV